MVRLREATPEDAFAIFKLAVFMHRETEFSRFSFNPQKTLDSIYLWLGKEFVLLAEKNNEIVGMIVASRKDHVFSDDVVACEDFFYVREDARGSRVAFMLMRGFMDWAKKIGAAHLRAGVSTGDCPAAERLYQHFGMKHVGGNYMTHLNRSEQ